MNCIFCKIINSEIPAYKLWENERFLALLDINPIKPGHLVVMPKAHYSDLYEMPEDLYSELFSIIKKIAPLLKKETGSKRVGLVVEGFGVDHIHVHLVPINMGNELNPENAVKATADDLQSMQGRIKKAFEVL